MNQRILITGSRTWEWPSIIAEALREYDRDIPTLVHGAAAGADTQAAEAAHALGWTLEPHPADWAKYGKRAGFVRNLEMVELGADICLAFILNGSRGATMCARLAEQHGIPVREWTATSA